MKTEELLLIGGAVLLLSKSLVNGIGRPTSQPEAIPTTYEPPQPVIEPTPTPVPIPEPTVDVGAINARIKEINQLFWAEKARIESQVFKPIKLSGYNVFEYAPYESQLWYTVARDMPGPSPEYNLLLQEKKELLAML